MKYLFPLFTLSLLSSCIHHGSKEQESAIVSMQTIDRNGFSETISTQDRLQTFANVDFLSPQPYQKVLRVYSRNSVGQSRSCVTSYHPNGQLWQYLEIVEGRAHGIYKEWHPNGALKVNGYVMEGLADVTEIAQESWLFEGMNRVYAEDGSLTAEIPYQKGILQGDSLYYFPNGEKRKILPYDRNELHGVVQSFSSSGDLLESIPYDKGVKNGHASGINIERSWSYDEEYSQGKLLSGSYTYPVWGQLPGVENGMGYQFCFSDGSLDRVIEIQDGEPQGAVRIFRKDGCLDSLYHIKAGLKEGEERFFYQTHPLHPLKIPLTPKLSIAWHQDAIHGKVKSWYENGLLESEREIANNKRQGSSSAYYDDGTVMLVEEYENDLLIKGSYFQKKSGKPISRIEGGNGTATLYFPEGSLKQKVIYQNGLPKSQ
jgi:antitoxin component YwqK of YwqJK toxin-antitoxin module